MKKGIVLIVGILCFILPVKAKNDFDISINNLPFLNNKSTLKTNFNQTYQLESKNNVNEDKTITELTKKVTNLLLGDFNNTKESSKHFYQRHQEYLALRYNPKVPKDENSYSGLDENSEEYKDDILSGLSVPGMFNKLNELNIIYNYFGNIRISKTDNAIMSIIELPNVTMKLEKEEEPLEYETRSTNLILYYYFKKLDNEYKLYYLMGETKDNLDDYFREVEASENSNSLSISSEISNDLNKLYSFDKINNITVDQINSIYDKNKNYLVNLSSIYNSEYVAFANGIIINDGLVLTTWNFVEKSLNNAQQIIISQKEQTYKMDGLVFYDEDLDLALIKLKEKTNGHIELGNAQNLKTEDPVICLSTQTGVGLTSYKGIVIANDNYLQTSIALSNNDQGSPLFNLDNQVIGLNNSKGVNSDISLAINAEVLKEIQTKFNNISFEDIDYVTFTKLKEDYYYHQHNNEIINKDLDEVKYKQYLKIGNIEKNINLELVKINKAKNAVSFRYKNSVSSYLNSLDMTQPFIKELEKQGFKQEFKADKKLIYKNNSYQIVIKQEFNYLIIVMVKL